MSSPGCLTAIPSARLTALDRRRLALGDRRRKRRTRLSLNTDNLDVGLRALTAIATPGGESAAPEGTITRATSGASSTTLEPKVPWPAMTAGIVKGWTNAIPSPRRAFLRRADAVVNRCALKMTSAPDSSVGGDLAERRTFGHEDGRADTARSGCIRKRLAMVARASGHDPGEAGLQRGDLVQRTAELE